METAFRTIQRWMALGVVAVSCCGLLAGCATGTATTDRTVWQLHDQYVKVEKQDPVAGGQAIANAHPVTITADRLRAILDDLLLRSSGEKGLQLFNDDELDVLGEHLHAGLMSAGPGEDVTFAVVGQYRAFMGLKQRMVTTGRVFAGNGELNIIFGNLHRPLRDNEDRRLLPFLPGRRSTTASNEGTLVAKEGGEPFSLKRSDWVVFPLEGPTAPPVEPVATKADHAPAASEAKPTPVRGKAGIAERLAILNDLHDKRLITDEEYRLKRLEILNEL